MHGIVSLLDNDHNQLIKELWADLEREFSVRGVYVTPYPHFSYHVAQDYDVDKIEPVLQRITSNITTFKVRTSGVRRLYWNLSCPLYSSYAQPRVNSIA